MSDQNTGDNQNKSTPQFGSGGKQEPNTSSTPNIDELLKRDRNAQQHIKTLESETADMRRQIQELREQLEQSKSIEDYLEAMRQQDNTNSHGSTAPQLDTNQLLAQVKEEVFKELSAAQRAELEQRNWQETEQMLRQKFGERYGFYVDERAKELEMTTEEMESLAKTKPKLFMELVSGPQKTGTPTPTKSSTMSFSASEDIESMYARVSRARRDTSSPEGRDAARLWSDPDFQAKYRQHILEKARREGKF